MSDPYPRESELNIIKSWEVPEQLDGLLELVEHIWDENYGVITIERKDGKFYRLTLVTGGWSGNEDIVNALFANQMFNLLYWEESKRGGYHVFEPSSNVLDREPA